jgi:hypothetical protein
VSVRNLLILHTVPLQYTLESLCAYTPSFGFYPAGIAQAMFKKDSKRKLFHMILLTGKQYIGSMTICVGNSNLVIAMPNHLSAEGG